MKWDDYSSNYSFAFLLNEGFKGKLNQSKIILQEKKKKKDSIQSVNKEENDHEDLSKLLT